VSTGWLSGIELHELASEEELHGLRVHPGLGVATDKLMRGGVQGLCISTSKGWPGAGNRSDASMTRNTWIRRKTGCAVNASGRRGSRRRCSYSCGVGRKKVLTFAVAVSLAVVVSLAGCGSPHGASETNAALTGPQPAGPTPSEIALEPCQSKAAGEIQAVLEEPGGAVVTDRTWVNHRYSCDYKYARGTMVLSIKELSSWAQTYAYFAALGKSLHETTTLPNLGQGAFQVRNGSVVVRKDWKILLVNTTGLPSEFGVPPTSSSDVAVTVAFIILGCWAGD
jgi:hypothetical protein